VLRDLTTGECVTRITPERLSPNLERRPWGLERRMILLPVIATLDEFIRRTGESGASLKPAVEEDQNDESASGA
jgi:hypothetical protein